MVGCVGSPDGEIMHVYWKQNNNILRCAFSDFGKPFKIFVQDMNIKVFDNIRTTNT